MVSSRVRSESRQPIRMRKGSAPSVGDRGERGRVPARRVPLEPCDDAADGYGGVER